MGIAVAVAVISIHLNSQLAFHKYIYLVYMNFVPSVVVSLIPDRLQKRNLIFG
jgi:hypothetical protein